jgi:hypothetical protein
VLDGAAADCAAEHPWGRVRHGDRFHVGTRASGDSRQGARGFVDDVIKPAVEPFGHRDEMAPEQRGDYIRTLIGLRKQAVKEGL